MVTYLLSTVSALNVVVPAQHVASSPTPAVGGEGGQTVLLLVRRRRIIADVDSGEDYVSTKPVFSQVKVSQ